MTDSSLVLTIVAVVLSFVSILYHIKVFSYWKRRGINGPTPWPLLGTSIYYIFWEKTEIDWYWFQKYGHTYGIYEGFTPALRTSDNEVIKYTHIKNFSSLTDRNHKLVFGDNMKRWFFWSSGKHWSNQRVLITPMFTSLRMRGMFSVMANCVDRFKQELNTRLNLTGYQNDIAEAKEAEKKKSLNLSKDEIMALSLDVIAQSFFSLKINTYQDASSEFFKRAYAFATFDVPYFLFWMMVPSSIAKYFKIDLTRYSKYEYFDKLSQQTINERRKNPSNKRNDFIQALLDAKLPEQHENVHTEEDDREAHYNDNTNHEELDRIYEKQSQSVTFKKFDDAEIRAQMTFFFLAGFETTSSSLSYCFYELAHQQDIQEELYRELEANPDFRDYSKLLSLKKLDAFISEALRLYCPVTEHNRIVTNPDGVTLPTNPPIKLKEGTTVSFPVFVLQRDPNLWEDPLKFDMTRFYPENRDKIKTCSYMPFGLGPRNCAGMRFALLGMKLTLAEILLKYKVTTGPKSHVYPPKFNRHFFFLQLTNTDFKLTPRDSVLENNIGIQTKGLY